MDSHPSCRRPHKLPAHTFKEPRSRPQRLPPLPRRFRRGEPLILAARLRFVTPLVRRKLPNRLAGGRSRFRRGSRTFWLPVWVSSTPREEVVFQTPHQPAEAALVSEPPSIGDFQKSASTSC